MRSKTSPAPTETDFKAVADAVAKIADVGRQLSASGLSRAAVLALLHDVTGLPKRDIKIILDALASLRDWCLTQ